MSKEILRPQAKPAPAAQPEQEPIKQWRQRHSPYWYDGYPDHEDGGGPYETRILYATPPTAQPEQEPVAWMDADGNVSDNDDHNCFPIPLYTTSNIKSYLEKDNLQPEQEMLANVKQARAAQATARIAITHLQQVLNKPRTHAEQQAADTAAREWLISIGSEPT